MSRAIAKHIDRRAVIKGAAVATAAGIVSATALRSTIAAPSNDPAVTIGQQYLEARDRFRAADAARDEREGEAIKAYPPPPKKLLVRGWPSTDGKPYLVYEDHIDRHFLTSKDRDEARRLFAGLVAEREAVNARFGITEMRAECDRLRDIEQELFDKLTETPATSIEGVALKLRAIQDWQDNDDPRLMMNGALNDAERLAGLELSAPFVFRLSDETDET